MKALMLSFFVLGLFISTPLAAVAQGAAGGGLITCSGVDCTTCDVISTANKIIDWLITILTVIFAVIIVWAGFKLVISGGNPQAKTEAKGYLTNAIIGFIIVLSAWVIIDTLIRAVIPEDSGTFDSSAPWSSITCYGANAPSASSVNNSGSGGTGPEPLPQPSGCNYTGPVPSNPDFVILECSYQESNVAGGQNDPRPNPAGNCNLVENYSQSPQPNVTTFYDTYHCEAGATQDRVFNMNLPSGCSITEGVYDEGKADPSYVVVRCASSSGYGNGADMPQCRRTGNVVSNTGAIYTYECPTVEG